MKDYLATILLLCLRFSVIKAQTVEHLQGPQAMSEISGNRYGPFHEIIKDTSQKTVTDFGHYLSIGFGGSNDHGVAGENIMLSYSLAYKSHLFSLTYAGAGPLIYGGGQNEPYYGSHYIGVLVGESVRFKHSFISVSTGIASSNLDLYYPDPVNTNSMIRYNPQEVFSIPIEVKAFLLARNGIGIGVHVSKNILSPYKYSPFYFGIAFVFGNWNTPRK